MHDIGLVFDALLVNKGSDPKETLSFEIRSEQCCLLVNGSYDCNVSRKFMSETMDSIFFGVTGINSNTRGYHMAFNQFVAC